MKNLIKVIFRLILVFATGLGLDLMLGISSGEFNSGQLVYYTILSNIAVFLVYLYLSVRSGYLTFKEKKVITADFPANIMGALTIMIILTGLVYNILLTRMMPDLGSYSSSSLSNRLLHVVSPLMVFVDWLFFVDKKKLSRFAPLSWIVIPLVYWVFTIVRAELGDPLMTGSYYPYPFIDIDQFGIPYVLTYVAGLIVVFIVLGYLMLALNHIGDRIRRK